MSSMHHNCESKKQFFFPTIHTKERPMSQTLLAMAKDLVMVQIAAQRLSPEEMHQALQHTYATLQRLQAQEEGNGSVAVITPETPPAPVNWKKNITKHMVTCLECGQSFKQLSARHLKEHALNGRSYREKYSIPRAQPLAAKEITARRKEIVQSSSPWEKAPTFVKVQEEKQREQTPMAQVAGAQRKRVTQKKGTARAKA
jgi:predicted transcriptional regulator